MTRMDTEGCAALRRSREKRRFLGADLRHLRLLLLACAAACPAAAQVRISTLPSAGALTGSELVPVVQAGGNATTTPAALLTYVEGHISVSGAAIQGTPTAGHCAAWYSATQIEDAGAACGSGSGGGITALTGDGTASGSGSVALTVTKTGGVAFAASATTDATNASNIASGTLPSGRLSGSYTGITGVGTLSAGSVPSSLVTGLGTFATQSYASPPAIGGGTPAAGTFSALTDTALTSGPYCVQETSGVLASTGSACGGSAASGANPTASVGLAAVNGSAATFLRSDGAPALSQSISPTWSGTHTFSNAPVLSGLTGYLYANGASAVTASTSIPSSAVSGLTAVGTASATNGVTLAMMAQAPANTLRSNPTGSTANVQDQAVPSCSATGSYLQYVSGTGLACKTPATPLAVTPSNPAGSTSTVLVMAGIGGTATITPAATGRLRITVNGDAYSSSTTVSNTIGLYGGTGTAPANGAIQSSGCSGACGSALGSAIKGRGASTTAGNGVPFSLTWVVTGLTVGTAYWIDLGFDTSNAVDAANLENLSVTATEF